MRHGRWLCAALALLMAAGALAEGGENLSSDTVYHLELRLAALGYFSGQADGIFDAGTRTALESFQQANGLEVTGAVDSATLDALNGEEIVSRQVYLKGYVQSFSQQEELQVGSSGREVQEVQKRLKALGFGDVYTDGVFGEGTQRALMRFQLANGLGQTGVLDASTRMRLMTDSAITWEGFIQEMCCSPGDSGLNVSALQRLLKEMGYFDGDVTGSYGELTQQAVRRFQRENALEETGSAGAETWERLYSGEAVAVRVAGSAQLGDTGERVEAARSRLIELGYLTGEAEGSFDYAMQTALRLFQMGAGLEATGVLDQGVEEKLNAEDARPITDEAVLSTYQTLLDSATPDTRERMAVAAESLLGVSFGTAQDEFYPGFAFVQYVCAAAGLPIRQPEALASMAVVAVNRADAVQAGDVVSLQSETGGSVSILLAVGAGDGKLYYATQDGGWVVLGYMDQMNGSAIYRWSAGGEA